MTPKQRDNWQALLVIGLAALLGLEATRSGGSILRMLLIVTIGAAVLGGLRVVHWLYLGPSMVGLLPVMSLADMLGGGGSHNLWPIEWFLYALLAIPATGGAWAGSLIVSILAGATPADVIPEPRGSVGADQKPSGPNAASAARTPKAD